MSGVADGAATLVVLVCRVGIAVIVSLAVLAISPALLGHTSTVVMSDSMAPGIRAGDVVAVRPTPSASIRVGMVVLVDDPSFRGRLRLHRVAERTRDGFVLKGDANEQRDPTPVRAAAVHGVGYLRVPFIGLPLLWLRTGQGLLAAWSIAGLTGAAMVVAVLDRTSGTTTVRVLVRVAGLARSNRRRVAVGAVGLLLAATAIHPEALPVPPSSWARFTATNSLPSNAFTTGTWCPALPKPVTAAAPGGSVPDIAYSFDSTGTAENNVGSLGGAYGAALSTAALRTAGTCSGGDSPSVTFTGGESVVSNQAYPPNTSATVSVWFKPTTAAGVLLDVGAAAPSATAADRQLYFTSSGGLAFAVRNGGTPASCTATTAVTLNAWHFAAVVYDSAAKTFTLYFDGQSTSCTGSFTTAPASTPSLRARLGNDAVFAADAAGGSYAGSIDEVYTWSTTMPASSIATVSAGGH